MSLPITRETIPLKTDATGAVRVGNTRVTLDTVIGAFLEGATAEEILQQYPSLKLADIYFAIGYYLRRRKKVEEYLDLREHHASEVRSKYSSPLDLQELRGRLLAREDL